MSYVSVDERTIEVMLRVSREESRPVTILIGDQCFYGCQKIELRDGYLIFWHPYTDSAFRIRTIYVYSISINNTIVITIDFNNEE